MEKSRSTAVVQIMSSTMGGTLHSLAALEFHARLGCFLFLAPRLETFEGLVRAHLPRVPRAQLPRDGGEQPRREASEFLLFSVPRRNSFLPSSPPWLEKGGGCSLKNERGPLVCPRFIFISFLPSPPFSRAPRKIICHRLPTILCLDTWTRGRRVGKRLDGGKEVNNVTDVQDFHCEISPFLQCLPMKQNSVAEGLRRATEFSYRTFFPLFRSANFRCQNGLRLNEVWSSRERKREDFEFLNNSRWRCFGMSTILKFF